MIQIKICSFDQSTKITGFAIFNDKELIKYGKFDLSDIDDVTERINMMKKLMVKLIKEYKIDKIILEDVQLQHNNVKVFKVLAQLQGTLLDYCVENDLTYEIVSPTTWKSRVGINLKLKREGQKRQSIEIVKHRFDIDVDDDIADAINLGYSQINK